MINLEVMLNQIKMAKKSDNSFFSGTEILGSLIHPGSVTTENGKTILHGIIQQAQDSTNDERASGDLTIETNTYMDAACTRGLLWGTIVMENPYGKWFAAWIGQKTSQVVMIYAMGYGIEAYQGLMANWTYSQPTQHQQNQLNIQGFIVRTD
jgi:hypothetical protein